MSHIVSLSSIKQYLPVEKLDHVVHDDVASLEEMEKDFIFGRLSNSFDTSLWAGELIPAVISGIISMRVAGRVYARQFSEESSAAGSYAQMLLSEADSILDKVMSSEIEIGQESVSTDGVFGIGDVEESDPIFTMGSVF